MEVQKKCRGDNARETVFFTVIQPCAISLARNYLLVVIIAWHDNPRQINLNLTYNCDFETKMGPRGLGQLLHFKETKIFRYIALNKQTNEENEQIPTEFTKNFSLQPYIMAMQGLPKQVRHRNWVHFRYKTIPDWLIPF